MQNANCPAQPTHPHSKNPFSVSIIVVVGYNKGKDTTPSANKVMLQLANIPKNKMRKEVEWTGGFFTHFMPLSFWGNASRQTTKTTVRTE